MGAHRWGAKYASNGRCPRVEGKGRYVNMRGFESTGKLVDALWNLGNAVVFPFFSSVRCQEEPTFGEVGLGGWGLFEANRLRSVVVACNARRPHGELQCVHAVRKRTGDVYYTGLFYRSFLCGQVVLLSGWGLIEWNYPFETENAFGSSYLQTRRGQWGKLENAWGCS